MFVEHLRRKRADERASRATQGVEHHDHGVADLDLDMPDAAFGVEHA
jgi:hypothetical protein